MSKSIEPNIADLGNGWLKSYNLDYKLEQESLNSEIDNALNEYFSKNGGSGGNRPDAKLLLRNKDLENFPILIEYKGQKGKLEKLNESGIVDNKTSKNLPNFKNINGFAVNGAVHYANALLHHTSYQDIIAIGMTGYKDRMGKIHHEMAVYLVSKSNFGVGQKIGNFSDFSFLSENNFNDFIENDVKTLKLSDYELEELKEKREREIDLSLTKLNNDIYKNEQGLGENDRVYLVVASIISTIGIPNKISPLEKSDLKSSTEKGNTDGDIVLRKISAFLDARQIPDDKKTLILRTLENTLTAENINKVKNGETQLKRVFTKIIDDLGIYYKIGLTTDFTGKLFNEMYSWLGFSQDKLNDVVLTPSYVSSLLVRLSRVNKDSYVWDFATGSAGLLISAMNEMLIDAKNSISSKDELQKKELQIKAEQLLGIELLPSVYMLAILNMILMGDGSSNILNKDSLLDFDGNYGFGKTNEKFPADAFILNPPYSAEGNGMIFVEKALNMMNKGYAAIIIQNSAGSGKAIEYNKRILEHHTLLASIKMPVDIFIGKANVQTNIYVFKVNEKHHKNEMVKFIDFSNDGYTRTSRKKSSKNLIDSDRAKDRYKEVVNLVRFGQSQLDIFTQNEYYEGTIDPENGSDWNQSAPIDTKPSIEDLQTSMTDYMIFETESLLRKSNLTILEDAQKDLMNVKFKEFELGKLFSVNSSKKIYHANKIENIFNTQIDNSLPYVVRTTKDNGIRGYILEDKSFANPKNTLSFAQDTFSVFYQPQEYFTGDKVKVLMPKFDNTHEKVMQYLTASLQKALTKLSWGVGSTVSSIEKTKIKLPVKDNTIDFDFMIDLMEKIEKQRLNILHNFSLNKIFKR